MALTLAERLLHATEENTQLVARIAELEKTTANLPAAATEVPRLQARVTQLETENSQLRQRTTQLAVSNGSGMVIADLEGKLSSANTNVTGLTAERDSLRLKVSQLEQSSGAYVENLGPKLRQAESVITRVHGFVAGLQLKNLTEEAATAKGVQLNIESITAQRNIYKKALLGITELVSDAVVQSTTSGNLTDRCLAAKGGKK